MRYLLDTNTCIAAMRQDAPVLQRLGVLTPADCVISTITTYELYTGVKKCADPAKELGKVKLLLDTVGELVFDGQAAREAGRVRALLESLGTMIGAYDVLLAGHALSTALTLVSANTAEFSRVPGLSLENWQLPRAR
ncbi:MAG: type II toxin-antitoxin system VapC family toxin [Pirellulales bacterium]